MFEDWVAETADMGEFEYTSFMRDGRGMAGMMRIAPDWGDIPPNWGVYLAVEDCDATFEKVASLGGQQIMPPQEVEQIGKFATVTDPQGAAFSIITLNNPE